MEKHIFQRVGTACAGFAAAGLLAPAMALAEEEERSGIALLIPTTSELIPACIAFVIIFLVLSKLVWPSVVKSMAVREKNLTDQAEAAEEARRKVAETAEECEHQIAEARAQAAEIVAQAKQDAEKERAEILYDAHIKATDAIEKGHKAVETERARAMEELAGSVTDLSVEIAGKIIGDSLDETEQRKLAMRYLEELESENA